MVVHPFKALRATPESACKVASVPYDVVDTAEARALAEDNPSSFLRVVRSEIDLPEGIDPYSDLVYEKAAENLNALTAGGHMVQDEIPTLYAYRMTMGGDVQLGLLACCSIDEYESGVIRKHELTRRDKEDDRTRHMLALNAQPGPVLVAYKDSKPIDDLLSDVLESPALLTCESETGVEHQVWQIISMSIGTAIVQAFADVPQAYIADGHHRSAGAARARKRRRAGNPQHTGREEYNYFLAALFPASQMNIMAYNRVVSGLNGHTPERVLELASKRFDIRRAKSAVPERAKRFCVYLAGKWYELAIKPQYADQSDPVKSLDSSILQEHFIEPVLGIVDIRADKRIKFVGGICGIETLAQRVDQAGDGIAFSMFPTSIEQLMAVADAGRVMPPKSTWFEPKLRSGLVVHII